MLKALEAAISRRGFAKAKISVLSANERALRLYRHCGYIDTLTQEAYDEALQQVLRKTVLEKRLTS